MKKILLASFITFSAFVFAQVPQGIQYQAIALNASQAPVVNGNVGLRLSILNTSPTGTAAYIETHAKTTNAQGLFNLVIGQGTPVSGTFAGINWASGSKFLKVEMDVAGGTNYVLTGTTQLLSAPYAMVADALVLSAGEGIVLTSPNGTPYTLSVNDSGQLSLPMASNDDNNAPANLFMYGTFNSFNASTALMMAHVDNYFHGFKYLTAGTEIKFPAQNNPSSVVYGLNGSQQIVVNGSAYTVPSNGFYYIRVAFWEGDNEFSAESIAPTLYMNNSGTSVNATYTVATNKFTFIVNGVTNEDKFRIQYPSVTGDCCNGYGDNLADGTLEYNGTEISYPGSTTTPKNYKVEVIVNFNGSATYTVVQL
jgi:hypothetical protein